MDEFLSLVGVQAMRYTVRSGIALTCSYAVKQLSLLVKTVDDENTYRELISLRDSFDNRVKVYPARCSLMGDEWIADLYAGYLSRH